MRSLFYKELRSMLPFLGLILFFIGVNFVFTLLAEYPDQYPLSRLMNEESRTGTQLFTFLIAFALASGLLVRERDEGTLAFLDALPVNRTQIFLCKFLTALACLWLLPLFDLVYNAAFHGFSRTSLETHLRWDILLTVTVLDGAGCLIYLCLGLALSFLGRFSLLVLGLLVWTYTLLKEMQVPGVALFNIFSLGDPIFDGQRWLIPWRNLLAQLGLALVSGTVAFFGFQILGDRAQRWTGKFKRWRGGSLLAGITTTAVIFIWFGLAIFFALKSDGPTGPGVQYTEWKTSRATTARYQFLYPENRGALVNQLLDRADAVEEKVRKFLGATPLNQIVVDMTTFQPRHAGRAYWKKVLMNLPYASGASEVDLLVSVLAHETTHVYLDHASEGRLQEQFNSTRFFHEGLASYVEYHLFLPPEKLASLRQVAAIIRSREQVRFEELLDDTRLRLKHDLDLVYPLGEVFVSALVKRYGEGSPAKLLKAFGRSGAPKGLKGFALWQDTFQSCDFNLSDVTDEFFAELDRAVISHRAFIDSLPRLRGAVEKSSAFITVRGLHEGLAPGAMVCRFRPRGDTEDRFYEFRAADVTGAFQVDKADYTERSFWYQLGWRVEGVSQVIYEPWIEVR